MKSVNGTRFGNWFNNFVFEYRTSRRMLVATLTSFLCSVLFLVLILTLIRPSIELSLLDVNSYNFFYNFYYSTHSLYWPYYLEINGISPGPGYYIFFIIGIISLVANAFIMPKEFRKIKITVFTNWFFYFIPLLAAIILQIYSATTYSQNINHINFDYSLSLGLIPIIANVFLQIAILIEKNTFQKWNGLDKNEERLWYKKPAKINFIVFIVVYILTILGFSLSLFIQSHWDDELYLIFMMLVVPIIFSLQFIWFIGSNFIVRKTMQKTLQQKSFIIDVILGEDDIVRLAEKYSFSVEHAQLIIRDALATERIFGNLSDDGFWFIADQEKMRGLWPEEALQKLATPIAYPSNKNRFVALILCLFFGIFGAHRFYAKRWITGSIYFLSCGLFGIGAIVDLIFILKGTFTDSLGNPIFIWRSQESKTKLNRNFIGNIEITRNNALRKIVLMTESLSIKDMTKLLYFNNRIELQRWLMTFPEEYLFIISNGMVYIPSILKGNTPEAHSALDKLLTLIENKN
ncbi:MAG: TM2 domain-containing protein [Candidatus Thorarchaeota archaeon]